MHKRRWKKWVGLGLSAGLFMGLVVTGESQAASSDTATTSGTISPDSAAVTSTPSNVDAATQADLERRYAEHRERIDAANNSATAEAPSSAAAPGRETQIAGESDTALVRKNTKNTVASTVGSTLTEPAAATDSRDVLYAGNTFQSRSTNTGTTWTNLGAYPAGPAEAPTPCCDADAVHHAALDTTFQSELYINSALTNGNVRIFVRHTDNSAVDCSYTIDYSTTANVLPDYPHLATGNTFLYLSSNNLNGGVTWAGAQMRRFNASQMSSCVTASFNTFTLSGGVGQRVITPAENVTTSMFWGILNTATEFRWFRWLESAATPTNGTAVVGASGFANPDCRGGTGNFDFIERSTAWSITGFRMRSTVAGTNVVFLWNSSPISGRLQAHLHGIALNTTTLAKTAEPIVFNQSTCFGFPALSGNADGDIGLSVAFGGKAGGAGAAAQGAIAVDDPSSAGIFFPALVLTASGTHNRTDSRYGDYFTVRRSDRCLKTWVATNYALSGGVGTANINARYIEFQSNTEPSCPV